MNVCFLLQDTRAVYGAERATLDLARGLRERSSADVSFLLIEERRLGAGKSGLQDALQGAKLSFDLLPTSSAFSYPLVRRIRAALRAARTDVLHTVGYKANLHGVLAARGAGVPPVVATVHGWLNRPDLKEQCYARLDLWALRRMSRVVALSRYYQQWLARKGIRHERLERIPSGIDADFADALEPTRVREDGAVTFGMLGRLSEEKNHLMFLRAVALLAGKGWGLRALIAGEGPEKAGLQQALIRLGLQNVVTMADYTDRKKFMEHVDVLVLCSRIENLPYTVLEAMACARPVVATQVGGLPDLVENGVTGFLVPPDDAEGLADGMNRVLASADRGRALGEAGKRKVLREFTPERCVEAHVRLYREVARREGGHEDG